MSFSTEWMPHNYPGKWLGRAGDFGQPLDTVDMFSLHRITLKIVNSIKTWLEVCKGFFELLVNQDKFIKHNSQSSNSCFTLLYNSYTVHSNKTGHKPLKRNWNQPLGKGKGLNDGVKLGS